MVEIIQKNWTKSEVLKRLGEALNKKTALESMNLDTSEVEVDITKWQERYNDLEE